MDEGSFLNNFNVNKKVGSLFLVLGIVILLFLVYSAGLFSSFSLSRFASLFFDDLEVIPLIISLVLIFLGIRSLIKKEYGNAIQVNEELK